MSVIDLGGMVFGLEPKQYLDDQHHPNKVCLHVCVCVRPMFARRDGMCAGHAPLLDTLFDLLYRQLQTAPAAAACGVLNC
jgi:hypothetical protein